MDIERGRVVISKAGRDKGKWLVCIAADGKYAFVADGKERPLEKPKKKNLNHIKLVSTVLTEETIQTNKSIKRALFNIQKKPE
jgi:Ribosomal protein L14E/L6E/L27E